MATYLEQTKQYLDSSVEHKEAHLGEILGLISDLMVNWKQAIDKGSKEEQREAITRLNQVRGLLQDYFEKVKEKLHLSPQEIEQLVQYATKRNTPNKEKIVNFRKEFERHSEEIVEMAKKKKKTVKRASRAGWIQS